MTEPNHTQSHEFKTACGGNLKDPATYPDAMYRGEKIYFCSRACLSVFERHPDLFMTSGVEHPVEEDLYQDQ